MADDSRPRDEDLPDDPFGEGDDKTPGNEPQRPLGPTPGEHSPASPGNGPIGFGGQSGAGGAGAGQSGGQNPFEALFGGLSGQGGGMPDMNALMQQLQGAFAMFGGGGSVFPGAAPDGGVNWDVTKDTARKTVASKGQDPTPNDAQRRAIVEAVSLAETWLDQATEMPRGARTVAAWSRADWVERTMPVWRQLIEPVATHIADAMEGALSLGGDQQGLPPQMQGMEQMLRPMLRSSGASMFGLQAGQALGTLATEVVGTTDIGLPLAPQGQLALLPTNLATFAEGLQQSADDVRIYLALREAARHRLYASAGWLHEQMLALIGEYARGITIDTSALEQAVGEIEGGNMDDLSNALEGGLFEPQKTPAQKATLERLETMLALVEGWVDDVVGQATSRWMPTAEAIAEMVRRRRATGGPAEATFATLVGLELRPRRLRDAANLWAAVRAERGADGRDAIWAHPDLLPSSADLDDPLGFAKGEHKSDEDAAFDAALQELLDNSGGSSDGSGADSDPGQGPDGGGKPDDSDGGQQ